MPATWVTCPVIQDGEGFRPLVSMIDDPGRPIVGAVAPDPLFRTICHSSVIDPSRPWCFSLIVGADFSEVIASGQVRRFIPQTWTQAQIRQAVKTYLNDDPLALGWTLAQRQAFRDELIDRGVTVADLDDAQPLWRYLRRLGRRLNTRFDPRRHHTFAKGVS